MLLKMGSGCDSVGRAVASDTREPQFGTIGKFPFLTINCIEKTKIKKERPGMAQFLKKCN